MTKYQIIVLCLLIASILSAVFEAVASTKKGTKYQLHRFFAVLTLLAILLIGYRAFFLIR
ncbi:MAG: hypothetical protein ABH860_04760 [bacterium]